MNVVYVCKAVDADSPTVATQARWIASLAAKPQIGRVSVLTQRLGRADLPSNVRVRTFGGGSWAGIVARFLAQAAQLRPADADFFFVAQGGPYPALLLPLKLAWRRPLYQWKAQPHVSRRMAFYARWCDDLVFTATPNSFPASAGDVRVVGHGIDTDLFRPPAPGSGGPERDLVAVGRVSPIKRLDAVIRAVGAARALRGRTTTLDIVGPAPAGDPHRAELERLVDECGLGTAVRFCGPVAHNELPVLLGRYRAVVNFSDTAFDKAAGEAMACGIPVITTNPCTVEMLPPALVPALSAARDDAAGQARAIAEVLSWEEPERAQAARELRASIVAHHGLNRLFDKILDAIASDRR